jgi:hypothetical protein
VISPDETVSNLKQAIIKGGRELFNMVPMYVRQILEERIWATQRNMNGELFSSFQEFVEHRLWEGLNTKIEDLIIFCRKDKEVVELILREVPEVANQGAPVGSRNAAKDKPENKPDNIRFNYGTNPTYTLARLRRDRPDLAEKVVTGEVSANAAAIEAGFRKKTIAIPDDENAAAEFLIKKWGEARAVRLADRIRLLA